MIQLLSFLEKIWKFFELFGRFSRFAHFMKWCVIFRGVWNLRGNHFSDKTKTVAHKWYCALTEKGAKARPNRFEFSRQNNWSFLIVLIINQIHSENTYFLQIFKMKTLWTFTALVLATLYHGSHQKPSQPSQSSSESKYCNFVDFFIWKSFIKFLCN